jgi:hypothetical protein
VRHNLPWVVGAGAGASLLVAIWSPYHWQFALTGLGLLLVAAGLAVPESKPIEFDGVRVVSVSMEFGGELGSIQIELGRGTNGSGVDAAALSPQVREALRRWVA